jgi:hypothetical protein
MRASNGPPTSAASDLVELLLGKFTVLRRRRPLIGFLGLG